MTSKSGLYLQLKAGDAVTRVDVPDILGYAPASRVVARPHPARGSPIFG